MPFKLLPDEALATGLKRIVEEQLSGAITQLEAQQDLNLSIYAARKYLKKARAVLRLLSPQLGPIYIEENRRLRDVARRFGSLRDVHVSLELVEKFAERYKRKSVLNPHRQSLSAKTEGTPTRNQLAGFAGRIGSIVDSDAKAHGGLAAAACDRGVNAGGNPADSKAKPPCV